MDAYAYASGLHNVNAGIKTIFSLAVLIFLIAVNMPLVSAFVTVSMAAVTVGKGRVKWKDYVRFLMIPFTFLFVGTVMVAVEFGTDPGGIWSFHAGWFRIYVTENSLVRAGKLAIRAMGGVSVMYFLALSTPVHEWLMVLRRLHVPEFLLELMHLTYRFIFLLTETWGHMNRAAASRLGYVDIRTSYHTFGSILANLFVTALKKASLTYDAMVARGYTDQLIFYEEDKPVRVAHVLTAVGYAAVLFLLLAVEKTLGL